MLLGMVCHLSALSSSSYVQHCLYQYHLLQIPQIPLLAWPYFLSLALSLSLSLALSDVVNPDRSMVLTSICLCSLLVLFDVMLGSSNIWSGGVTVAFLTEWDLHEFDCLTCNGITDLTCLITPTFVFICNTISCLDWFTTGAWK